MKARLKLIAPAQREGGLRRSRSLFPPLSLAAVAALTPADWDISIADESVQDVEIDGSVDLVGITVLTAVAPRAYFLADAFRRRGVKVVLGGIHVSALPEEAAAHADAVVVGEAEGVWGTVLDDFRRGRLQRFYVGTRQPELAGLPTARRDLFDPRFYLTTGTIQTSRGCPYNCSFCSVTRFFGRTYRVRPVEEVVREIEGMRQRLVLFVDDNIIGCRQHARRLFEALKGMRVRWLAQSSLNIAFDAELLALAAKGGCVGLFIGFESLVAENIRRVGKAITNKVERFREAVRRIHDQGIGIEGAFIFGFDRDDESIFGRTVGFAENVKLDAAQFGILTPFPGTPLREQLEREGRIVVRDWSRYTISDVVFEPRLMSGARLREGFNWAYREFYSWRSIAARLLAGIGRNLPFYLPTNILFRRFSAHLANHS